ncbi:hypothetical protein [Haloglomus halophilum]|uniref:hypothetical protein n=1 Tax=Haloglomus halophilum TaxID=2962672 RepID=UPI0020C9F551|nr:hypothetical protein [Haloglomus halophilum]
MSRDDTAEAVTDDSAEYDDLGPDGGPGDDLAPAGLDGVTLADLDPGPLVTGAFVGLAGFLFLLQPVVPFVELGALRVRPVALSALALAVGLWLGAAVYLRRGKRLVGGAHAVGAVGWSGIVLGTATGNGTVLLGAIVVLVVGMVALAVESRRYA